MVLIRRRRRKVARKNPTSRKAVLRSGRIRRNAKHKSVSAGKHRVTLTKEKSGWKGSSRGYVRSGTRINPRRRRKYVRANPFNIKKVLSKEYLLNMASVGGGIAAGFLLMPLIETGMKSIIKKTEDQVTASKFLGGVHVVLGFILGTMAKNPQLRQAGYTISATGLYDLIVSNVPGLTDAVPALPRTSVFASSLIAEEHAAGDYAQDPYSGVPSVSGDYGPLAGDTMDDVYALMQ